MELGMFGIWSLAFTHGDPGEAADAAAEAEELGYETLWLGGDPGGNPRGDLVTVARMLDATRRAVVAPACVSVWDRPADQLARAYHALPPADRERLVIGLGVSHGEIVSTYRRPYTAMAGYLEELDSGVPPLPVSARLIGAHGPRMTRLAADRTLGVHPYLVDTEHVIRTRELLGDGPLLALEQTVVAHTDPAVARARARWTLSPTCPWRTTGPHGCGPDSPKRTWPAEEATASSTLCSSGETPRTSRQGSPNGSRQAPTTSPCRSPPNRAAHSHAAPGANSPAYFLPAEYLSHESGEGGPSVFRTARRGGRMSCHDRRMGDDLRELPFNAAEDRASQTGFPNCS